MGIIEKIKQLFGWGEKPKEETPTQRLQRVIDLQTAKLAAGRTTLQRSFDIVARLQRERDVLQADVNTLTTRAAKDPDPTHPASIRLASKKKELELKQADLDAAVRDHDSNLEMIERYNREIADARLQAQRLSITLDLANANSESAKFQADLQHGLGDDSAGKAREEVEAQIRKANAEAAVARSLSGEDKKEQNDEYLKAADEAGKVN